MKYIKIALVILLVCIASLLLVYLFGFVLGAGMKAAYMI